jgi:hypothetical protein
VSRPRRRPLAGIFFLALALLGRAAFADEGLYTYPDIPPHLELRGGYRLVGVEGSPRAAEYEYLRDSLQGGVSLVAFPFPHRIHLETDVLNKKDIYGDLRYAYSDMVLARWVKRSLFHNLNNVALVSLGPSSVVERRNKGEEFHLDVDIDDAFLRLKAHTFPLHVFAENLYVSREGDVQQRFLGGSGFFNDLRRVSERRHIDWETRQYRVGANSHLGPVEAEYSHTEMRFDSGGGRFSTESYTAAVGSTGTISPAGVFPHGLVPDLEGSTNTVRLHTSHTGRVVAAVTVSDTDRTNTVSGAEAESFLGAGSLRLIPMQGLTLRVRYRVLDVDVENPSALPDDYLGFTAFTPLTGIKPSLSRTDQMLSTSLSYRVRATLVKVDYLYREIDRENARLWDLPETTSRNEVTLSVRTRLRRRLKGSVRYTHREVDDPAYNTSPDRADRARVSLTWHALERLQGTLHYDVLFEGRDHVSFEGVDAGDRDRRRDKVAALLAYGMNEKVSVSTGYAYIRNRVTQGAVAGGVLSPRVRYRDEAHNVFAGVQVVPLRNLTLRTSASHTLSRAHYGDFSIPVSVVELAEVKVAQNQVDVAARYAFGRGWGLAGRWRYLQFDNRAETPLNPTVQDGEVHIVMLTASKSWN